MGIWYTFYMSYRPSRNILLLGLTSFFNDLSSEMILSIFPAFFISVLKAGAGSLGFIEGLADGASNIIKIYAGKLSDRTQKRRPLIISGYALSVCVRPFYTLVGTVAGVAGLRFTDRIGKGLREGPRDAVISLSTSREETGRAFGFHRMLDTLGAIVGPLIAYLILRAYPDGFHIVFLAAFVLGICAVFTVLFVTEAVGAVQRKDISLSSFALFSSEFKRYLLALLFLSFGSIPVAVLLLKTQNIGLTLASIPLFYLLYNVTYAGFSYGAGKLSDKHGHKKIIIIGYLLLVLGYIFLARAEHTIPLAISFCILGLFPALTDGVQRAFASTLSGKGERGSALGYVNAVSGVGLLCAGIVGGYVWQVFGVNVALWLAGILALFGLGVLATVNPARSLDA